MFMRVAVPVFGTAPVAEARALFASLFLLPWVMAYARLSLAPRTHWRDYLTIGLANNVLPFICFAWAATVLPAGYMAVINGTVPLWTALFSAWLLHERLGVARLAGFLLGLLGVGMIVPLLGIFWGWLILGEAVTLGMLAGAALVLAALALVMKR